MNLKNLNKHLLGRYPGLFFPIYKMLAPAGEPQERMVADDKELVIEGFPRSANTFAVVAFQQAQCRPVSIAHHLHVEAQILRGVKMGLPVIVLLRNPVEAITSLLIMYPTITSQFAFRWYTRFYKAVESVHDRVVIATFEEVTKNYGAIIQRVNLMFDKNYTLFEHTKDNVHRVYKEIEQINEVHGKGKETHMGRPSKERNQMKKRLRLDVKRDDAKQAFEAWKNLRARAMQRLSPLEK